MAQPTSQNVGAANVGPSASYCTFHLGGELYGIDVLTIKEVSLVPPLTPIPHAPADVGGYVNLRGQIHLVLDLKHLLGLGTTGLTADTRLVLFKASLGDPFGVLVDRIGEITVLPASRVEKRRPHQADAASATEDDLVAGVGELAGELLIVLDARRFLNAAGRGLKA